MSERMPWAKFSWTAWETDDELSMCSMAAQGFWMRLLCMAAKEDGIVALAGKAPTVEKLAFLTRQSVEDVTVWLAELEAHEVFSRDGRGRIYSRRMTRDARISRRNQRNGKKGGNPNLRKDTGNQDWDNPKTESGVKADKEEEREIEPPVVPQGDGETIATIRLRQADVEEVWSITPHSARTRTSRADVRTALQAAARRGQPPELIIAGLKAYYASPAATKDNGQYAKGAHRMIEKDRYLDFLTDAPGPAMAAPADPWPRRVREFARNGHWNAVDWGPRPGKPDCRAPPDLISEHCPTLAKDRAA